MRHRVLSRRFHRSSPHRQSMFANMASSLVKEKKIETTVPKAKVLRPIFEKLLTIARSGDSLNNRRYLLGKLHGNKEVVDALFELSKSYIDRSGGYTRIIKSGFRKGDAAPVAIISLV